MTHLGADWVRLKNILEQNPKIQVFQTDIVYRHHEDLKGLWDRPHYNNNAAAWWADVILTNKNFASKQLAKYHKYLYFVAGPECLPKIPYEPICAAAYYRFRLRGLSQWHKRSGGPWICESDLDDEAGFVKSLSEIDDSLSHDFKTQIQQPKVHLDHRKYNTLFDECKLAYQVYDAKRQTF